MWIKVKDKLPDETIENIKLIFTKNKEILYGYLTSYWFSDMRSWTVIKILEKNIKYEMKEQEIAFDDVTHWMDLPSKPIDVEENTNE